MKHEGWAIAGAVGAVVAGYCYAQYATTATAKRASNGREVPAPSIRGAALDATLGQVTPDHLRHWYGPPELPAGWQPHRMCYPHTPGYELERITHGAPGCCVTPAVPRAQRGWLFCPPAEVDY